MLKSTIENVRLALSNTFNYKVKFTKENKDQKIFMFYSNPLFKIDICGNDKMIIDTHYLSPCMYLRHNFVKEYEKIGDIYILKSDGYDDGNSLTFNIIDEVPIDFIIITKLFGKYYDKCDTNIKDIKITKEQEKNKINKYLSKYNLEAKSNEDLIKLCNKQNAYKDYYQSGSLVVHNNQWATADMGLNRLNKKDYFSDFTKEIIKNIDNDLSELDKLNNDRCDTIGGIAKLQGGLNLSSIGNYFGYGFINNFNELNEDIIRCTDSLQQSNSKQTFKEYGLCECNLQSIVILNEFLIHKYELQTTLDINIYTYDANTSNTIIQHRKYSNYKEKTTFENILEKIFG